MKAPSRVAAVIGHPVRHSRSPAIHNAAFAAVGLDWTFTALEVPAGDGAAALEAMRALDLAGLSVTMPLKGEAAAAADEADDDVTALGAANCIVPLGGGRLRAANTDIAGFTAALRHDAGIDPEGRRVVLLGAGGAARAVARGLAASGACDIAVVNRTHSKAVDAARLAGDVGRVGTLNDVAGADIVINATPVGMGTRTAASASARVSKSARASNSVSSAGAVPAGSPVSTAGADLVASSAGAMPVVSTATSTGADPVSSPVSPPDAASAPMPCDPALLRHCQVAVDLIYEPLETAWLAALRRRGVEAHNGLSMLVFQAVAAFELWTGIAAPVEVMRQAATAGD